MARGPSRFAMRENHPPAGPCPPELLEAWRIGEASLARAYGRVGDQERALIKSLIALAYAGLEPGRPVQWSRCARIAGETLHIEDSRPRPWCLLVLGPETVSAPQAVAAVMPAIVRRIPRIMAVRPRSRAPWPAALLTAFELAGVEALYGPPRAALADCLRSLACPAGGSFIYLGQPRLWDLVHGLAEEQGSPAVWLKPPAKIGVWAEPGLAWDEKALRLVHPDAEFQVWGGVGPAGFPACEGDFEDFCRAGYQTVYAPPERWPDSAGLCLGPGREFFWHWPEMSEDVCHTRRTGYRQG